MLALEFNIYLIDEGMPSSTDAEFNHKSANILQERLRTTTIIIVSHQPEVLEKFALSVFLRHQARRQGQCHLSRCPNSTQLPKTSTKYAAGGHHHTYGFDPDRSK